MGESVGVESAEIRRTDARALDYEAHSHEAYRLRYAETERAADAARSAIDLLENPTTDPLSYARALLVKGIHLNRRRDYGAAREVLNEAREMISADAPFYGELLVVLGQSMVFSSAPGEGLEPLQAAYEIFQRGVPHLSDTEQIIWQGRTAFYLGATYHGVGDFPSALQWFLTALKHDETVGFETYDRYFHLTQSERLPLMGNIAIIYDEIGEYDNAIRYYNLLLEEVRQGEYREAEMTTLYNLGLCLNRQGKNDEALGYLQRCIELCQELDRVSTEAGALHITAEIYLRKNEDATAEAVLARANDLIDPIREKYPKPHVHILSRWGDLRLKQHRYEEAIAYFHDALAVLEQHGILPHLLIGTHNRLAKAYRSLGEFEKGLEHLDTAYRLDIDYHKQTYTDNMQTLLVKFDVEKARQDREIYRLKNVELEREIAERRRAEEALARKVEELETLNARVSKQAQDLKSLSERDGLTGLYNRRMLDDRLANIFADSVRDDTLLCTMICDIDNFKSVNDTFSHATGDEVLRQIARIVEAVQPRHSLSARYGGEEFVIVFPGLTIDESYAACETLRERIEGYDWATVHPDLVVTLSLGLARRRAQENHEKLLSDADSALYQAKRSGKNQVWLFSAYS